MTYPLHIKFRHTLNGSHVDNRNTSTVLAILSVHNVIQDMFGVRETMQKTTQKGRVGQTAAHRMEHVGCVAKTFNWRCQGKWF